MVLKTLYEIAEDPIDKSTFEVLYNNAEFAFMFEGIECYYANKTILGHCKAMTQMINYKDIKGIIFITADMKNKPLDISFETILWHELGHIHDIGLFDRTVEYRNPFCQMSKEEREMIILENEYIADAYAAEHVGIDALKSVIISDIEYHKNSVTDESQYIIEHLQLRLNKLNNKTEEGM